MSKNRITQLAAIVVTLLAISALMGAPTTQPQRPGSIWRLAFRLVAPEDADRDPANFEMLPEPFTHAIIPVNRQVLLDETDIATVNPNLSQHTVNLEMTATGAAKLEQVTRDNIGRRLAVVLDGQVLAAPTIRSVVSKAAAISMRPDWGDDEVRKLANELEDLIKRSSATQPATQR